MPGTCLVSAAPPGRSAAPRLSFQLADWPALPGWGLAPGVEGQESRQQDDIKDDRYACLAEGDKAPDNEI